MHGPRSRTPRPVRFLRWLTRATFAVVILAAILVGIPALLVAIGHLPLPTRMPDWHHVQLALRQGDIPSTVVLKTIATLVWIAWLQLAWALLFELTVNLPRTIHGLEARRPPLTPKLYAAGAGRLVSLLLSIGMAATTITAPPLARPANAAAPAPSARPALTLASPTAEARPVASASACTWRVAPGDSLWAIAETALGDGSHVKAILELNPHVTSPRLIRPGQLITLPDGAVIPADRLPAAAEPILADEGDTHTLVVDRSTDTTMVVRSGDTVWHIAQDHLTANGHAPTSAEIADYVHDIATANADTLPNPSRIYAGQELDLPALDEARLVGPEEEPAPAADAPAPADTSVSEPSAPAPVPVPISIEPSPSPTVPPPPSAPDVRSPQSSPTTWAAPASPADSATSPTPAAPSTERSPWLAGAAGTITLASALILVLRRLRARRAARGARRDRRRPTEHDALIDQIARAADVPLVRWAAHELATLLPRLKVTSTTPTPIAAELSERYGLELLWDTPNADAPHPWEAADDGWAWRLLYDPDLPIPNEPGPVALPGLVTIGERDGNQVLVNLEAVGSLAITGDPGCCIDFIRSLVLELGAGDDLANSYVQLAGIDLPGTEHLERVLTREPADAHAFLLGMASEYDTMLEAAGLSTTFQLRASTTPEGRELAVVVCRADDLDRESVRQVRPHRAATLLLVGDTDAAEATIEIDDQGNGILRPLGIRFTAAGVPGAVMGDLMRALGDLAEAPAPEHDELFDETIAVDVDAASLSDARAAVPSDEVPGEDVVADEPAVAVDGPLMLPTVIAVSDGSEGWLPPEPGLLVRVLGAPAVVGYPDLGRIEVNVVTFLALHRNSATDEQVIDAVWNGRKVEMVTLWKRMSRARAVLGRFVPTRDQRANLVHLTDDVACDLTLLEAVLDELPQMSATEALIAARWALDLIDGRPFDAPGYDWAHEQQEHARACDAVETLARQTVDLALAADDLGLARYAVEQGLRALPLNEPLYRARMSLEAQAGNLTGVKQAYNELTQLLAEVGGDGFPFGPSTRTTNLYNDLVGAV